MFDKKWGLFTDNSLDDRIVKLEKKVKELQEKYNGALWDIKRLEEENIETTNVLYELETSINAIYARIDILNIEKIEDKENE